MREVDRLTIEEYGILLIQMMENAGRSLSLLTSAVARGVKDKSVLVLAGRGNNGGGALVAARHLSKRLLNIGCGWGGLGVYAAEKYGVDVLGVTLSTRQAEYAQASPADGARVELIDYRVPICTPDRRPGAMGSSLACDASGRRRNPACPNESSV